MKITRIEREVSGKVFVGGYETVEPCIRVSAEVDVGEDIQEIGAQLSAIAQELWAFALEDDIKLVQKRRMAMDTVWSDDKTAELLNYGIPGIK